MSDQLSTRKVIAMDGMAGSGKTTLAKMLAERLGFCHLNTGLLYRGIGWFLLHNDINPDDENDVTASLNKCRLELLLDKKVGQPALYLNGEPVTVDVNTLEVSEATSKSSRWKSVRDHLMLAQRNALAGHHIVAEGRDMATVVFPDAPLKFFVTADVDVRVVRRLSQLKSGSVSPEAIKKEIMERDARDTTRENSPTIPAKDSIMVDNSLESLTDIVQRLYDVAVARGLASTS